MLNEIFIYLSIAREVVFIINMQHAQIVHVGMVFILPGDLIYFNTQDSSSENTYKQILITVHIPVSQQV